MKKMSSVCDWFVIASATSTTHSRAIADNIIKKLKDKHTRPWHLEGEREASWILLDYGDVVAHIFLQDTRAYYDLEKLWGDAPQEQYEEGRPAKKAVRKARFKKPRKKARTKRRRAKRHKK